MNNEIRTCTYSYTQKRPRATPLKPHNFIFQVLSSTIINILKYLILNVNIYVLMDILMGTFH